MIKEHNGFWLGDSALNINIKAFSIYVIVFLISKLRWRLAISHEAVSKQVENKKIQTPPINIV